MPIKEDLLQKRLVFLKEKKVREYAKCIGAASKEYSRYMTSATNHALDFIKLDDECYEASFKEASSIPEIAARLRKDEELVRLRVEQPREITQTRDEIKNIILEQTRSEGDLELKIALQKGCTEKDKLVIYQTERTKIMDKIYMRYNLKVIDIMHAVKQFDLEHDPEVEAARNANSQQRENLKDPKLVAQAAAMPAIKLTEEQKNISLEEIF